MSRRIALLAVVFVAAVGGRAFAYPQFELSKDQTCSGCHISPAGGGLLTENGLNTAESISQFGTAPEFFYNKVPTPSWLTLGGDLRGAYGFLRAPQEYLIAFPMQAEVYANAKFLDNFRVQVTAGVRPPESHNQEQTTIWSREHYVMWQSNPSGHTGLYVRVGRFMPVFGLRFAEHPVYTRLYGGTPLYSETYGAAAEYISDEWEAHVTGFIRDPIIDPVAHDDGVAGYAEYRLTPHAEVGVEGMYTKSPDDSKYRGGATAKVYIPQPDLLVMGEGQVVNQHIEQFGIVQVVAYAMITKYLPDGFMADLGLGYYNENVRIRGLDRDCLDFNLHWFATSHIELIMTNRVELIHGGLSSGSLADGETTSVTGGPTGSYVLFQGHYRL